MQSKKILILYASYGAGHKMVAESIKNYFDKYSDDTLIVNFYNEIAMPKTNVAFEKIHKATFKKPVDLVYKGAYTLLDKVYNQDIALMSSIGFHKLHKYVILNGVTDIICTFPINAAFLLAKKKIVKTHVVLTDFSTHAKWFSKYATTFFVPNREISEIAINSYKIDRERIIISQIPIREQFESKPNRLLIESEFDIDRNKPNILINMGARAEFQLDTNQLKEIQTKANLFIICGRNIEVFRKYTKELDKSNVFGFVQNMSNLYSISDYIISKSGGSTANEIFHFGKRLLTVKTNIIQEQNNIEFLKKNKLAKEFKNKNSLLLFLLNKKLPKTRERSININKANEIIYQAICLERKVD